MLFFHIPFQKINYNSKIAFNVNLIYKLNEDDSYNKIYLIQCNKYLLNKLVINKTAFYLNNEATKFFYKYDNYISDNLRISGFFNSIVFFTKCKNESLSFIFNAKFNPIVRKIKIQNYYQLQIPKKKLIQYFQEQIGLPLNYKLIDYNIKQVYRWYLYKGFKWATIDYRYNYTNNEIDIHIDEGRIGDVILRNKGLSTKKSYNRTSILFNKMIKTELELKINQILNIYKLELNIKKLSKISDLHNFEYSIKNTFYGLIINIYYNSFKNHRFILNKYFTLKDCIDYLKNYLISIDNIQRFYVLKYIKNSINYFTENINACSFIYVNKYNCFSSSLFYLNQILISYKLYIIRIIFTSIELVIDKFFSLNITIGLYIHKINIKYISLYKFYGYNFNPLKEIYSYPYIINLLNVHLKIKHCLHNIQINHTLIAQFNTYFQRLLKILSNEFLRNYTNNIYRYYVNLLSYNVHVKFKVYSLLNFTALKNIYLFKIYYKIYAYLGNIKSYMLTSTRYYMHIIEIQYKKFYKMPKILYFNNGLNIYLDMKIFIGSLRKNLIIINKTSNKLYISTFKKNIHLLLDIEYLICVHKYKSIYFFINYIPLKIIYLTYPMGGRSLENSSQYINTGLGVQFNIPIKSIPIIRLEFKLNSLKASTFYTYLIPKLNQ